MGNVLNYNVLRKDCDTCDSKKCKTPVMCARTRTRERGVIGIFTIRFSIVPTPLQRGKISNPSFDEKTTRRFMKSDPLFFEK